MRNGEVSKLIAAMWRDESEAVRESYYAKAAEEKRRHSETYPGYKYRPKKQGDPAIQRRPDRQTGATRAGRRTRAECPHGDDDGARAALRHPHLPGVSSHPRSPPVPPTASSLLAACRGRSALLEMLLPGPAFFSQRGPGAPGGEAEPAARAAPGLRPVGSRRGAYPNRPSPWDPRCGPAAALAASEGPFAAGEAAADGRAARWSGCLHRTIAEECTRFPTGAPAAIAANFLRAHPEAKAALAEAYVREYVARLQGQWTSGVPTASAVPGVDQGGAGHPRGETSYAGPRWPFGGGCHRANRETAFEPPPDAWITAD